jgi:hypothetical protein
MIFWTLYVHKFLVLVLYIFFLLQISL